MPAAAVAPSPARLRQPAIVALACVLAVGAGLGARAIGSASEFAPASVAAVPPPAVATASVAVPAAWPSSGIQQPRAFPADPTVPSPSRGLAVAATSPPGPSRVSAGAAPRPGPPARLRRDEPEHHLERETRRQRRGLGPLLPGSLVRRRPYRKAIVLAVFAAAASLALAGAASAHPAAHDTAAAEAAFAEARALIRQGQYIEACPKLEASFTLDPALGTLLNLSDCFERTGRTASAWVRYREAAAMAVQQGHREREAIARERIAALEPQLCRLTVRTSTRPNLEVKRDGVIVDRAAIGLPVPVDRGRTSSAPTPQAQRPTPYASRSDLPEKNGRCAVTVVEIPSVLNGEGASAGPPAA